MTREAQIAAEVGTRYGCAVLPEAVKIIPRGVSAFALGAITVGGWKEQRARDWAASVKNRARVARVVKAQEAMPAPEKVEKGPSQDQASRHLPKKKDAAAERRYQAERTEKRRGEIRALRKADKSPEECAVTLGMTVMGVRRLATLSGYPWPGAKLPAKGLTAEGRARISAKAKEVGARAASLKEARRDNLVLMVNEGKTVADMCALYGMRDTSIKDDLRARGIGCRDGGTRFIVHPLNCDEKRERERRHDALRKLVGKGLTIVALSKMLGAGVAQISRDLKSMGLDNGAVSEVAKRKIIELRAQGRSCHVIAREVGVSLKCVTLLVGKAA